MAAAKSAMTFVSTTLVVAEMHALLLRWRDVATGRRFLDATWTTPSLVIVAADVDLTRAAVQSWIARFRDQRFTLCDALSFEVMRREGIAYALAFDRHFEIAGFETLRDGNRGVRRWSGSPITEESP